MLSELSPRGMHGIFERMRGILHEGDIDKRVQYMIEGLHLVRKNKFADFPGVMEVPCPFRFLLLLLSSNSFPMF